MLIHPWDATLDRAEWQEWLASTDRFGMLAVNNLDPTQAPIVLPTHFTLTGDELLVHLARPNPIWPHIEAAGQVLLAVSGDYAYIPSYWRAKAGGPDEDGVPTSYYTAVQFVCRPTVVDDPQGKADILTAQLADLQPEGGHATMGVGAPPYGRMLPGIRGVRLAVLRVDAKFKYDDHNPVEHRERVIDHLEHRGHGPRRRGREPATASAGRHRRLDDPPRRLMTRRHASASVVPPWGLALTAMLSVQLGSALSMPVIDTVGPAGTAWLRLSIGAVIFLAFAPPLRFSAH